MLLRYKQYSKKYRPRMGKVDYLNLGTLSLLPARQPRPGEPKQHPEIVADRPNQPAQHCTHPGRRSGTDNDLTEGIVDPMCCEKCRQPHRCGEEQQRPGRV